MKPTCWGDGSRFDDQNLRSENPCYRLEPGDPIAQCSGHDIDQGEAFAYRAEFTADLTRAANALYDGCLRVQNAARLEYPTTQSGTEAARRRFQLDTFLPRDRSQPDGGTPPPASPAPANPPPTP